MGGKKIKKFGNYSPHKIRDGRVCLIMHTIFIDYVRIILPKFYVKYEPDSVKIFQAKVAEEKKTPYIMHNYAI